MVCPRIARSHTRPRKGACSPGCNMSADIGCCTGQVEFCHPAVGVGRATPRWCGCRHARLLGRRCSLHLRLWCGRARWRDGPCCGCGHACLGFGRSVASETQPLNVLGTVVESGWSLLKGAVRRTFIRLFCLSNNPLGIALSFQPRTVVHHRVNLASARPGKPDGSSTLYLPHQVFV